MYLLIIGAAFQLVAYALLGTMSEQQDGIPARQYGYLFLAGWGCGITNLILSLMTPFATEKRDHAVAIGAITQFRIMGGAMGLAIATAIQHGYLRSHLSRFLGGDVVEAMLSSTPQL